MTKISAMPDDSHKENFLKCLEATAGTAFLAGYETVSVLYASQVLTRDY